MPKGRKMVTQPILIQGDILNMMQGLDTITSAITDNTCATSEEILFIRDKLDYLKESLWCVIGKTPYRKKGKL